jgi:hypothetical protein
MAYSKKIDWRDPAKSSAALVSTRHRFKSAVLDFQVQVEGELADIITRHFQDPSAYNLTPLGFERRIELVRALVGETPDDDIWPLIKSLGQLRNKYSHSRFVETAEGKAEIATMMVKILEKLKRIRPDLNFDGVPDADRDYMILTESHFVAQRFFREINEGLDHGGVPKLQRK